MPFTEGGAARDRSAEEREMPGQSPEKERAAANEFDTVTAIGQVADINPTADSLVEADAGFFGVDEYGEAVFDENDPGLLEWLAKVASPESRGMLRTEVPKGEVLSLLNRKAEELRRALPDLPRRLLQSLSMELAEEDLVDFGYIEGLLGQPMMEMKERPEVVREWGRQVKAIFDGVMEAWPADAEQKADFRKLAR